MRIHRIAVSFLVGVWLPVLALAQAADSERTLRIELARKILDVSFKQDVFDRMMRSMDQQMSDAMLQQIPQIFESTMARMRKTGQLTDAQLAAIRERLPAQIERFRREEIPRMSQFMNESMQRLDMKKILYEAGVPFYVESFSAAELQQILGFQSSAVGQKMIERTPELMSRLMPVLMGEIGKIAESAAALATEPASVESAIRALK